MPRRNVNAAERQRIGRATHVLVHLPTGRIFASGRKAELWERADNNNAVEATQTWAVKPIHK